MKSEPFTCPRCNGTGMEPSEANLFDRLEDDDCTLCKGDSFIDKCNTSDDDAALMLQRRGRDRNERRYGPYLTPIGVGAPWGNDSNRTTNNGGSK